MDTTKVNIYLSQKANPSTVWLLFLFFGWSYGSLGKIGTQILYYITLGGFGLWMLVRLFTLQGAIKKHNRDLALRIGLTEAEIKALG